MAVAILRLVLRVVVVLTHAHVLVLFLDHASTRVVLEVTLLLVSLDGDVGIDTVEVFLLLGKHGGEKVVGVGAGGPGFESGVSLLLIDLLIVIISD